MRYSTLKLGLKLGLKEKIVTYIYLLVSFQVFKITHFAKLILHHVSDSF